MRAKAEEGKDEGRGAGLCKGRRITVLWTRVRGTKGNV